MPKTLRAIWNSRQRPTLVRLESSGETVLLFSDAHAGLVHVWAAPGVFTAAGDQTLAEELPTTLKAIRAALPLTPVIEAEVRRWAR